MVYPNAKEHTDLIFDAAKRHTDSINSLLLANFDRVDSARRQINLGEVVVTARESRGTTSASLIDRQAMAHLQPSSFTDLVELLPGYVSKDPAMGEANLIRLRQATQNRNDDYNTSSLGTAFVVDGVPLSSAAEMQATGDADRQNRLSTGKGVDMRQLSTDDIESVEIVRGIPSAEYGDLTSGLVKIKRKSGVTGLEARFKADMQSQLFYIGKGFGMPAPGWTVNVSADYLDSRIDPRDNRDNFKRVTFSTRSNLRRAVGGKQLTWDASINYTGTFERDKNDPDLTVNNTIDYYTNSINRFSLNNAVALTHPAGGFFRSASFTSGIGYSTEHLHQEKTVAATRLYPLPVSLVPGPNDVGFLPMLYIGNLDVYGRPLTIFTKLSAVAGYSHGNIAGTLKTGLQWDFSKNYGRGQVYDLTRPITPGNTSRPRPYRDVPAINQLSAYVENESNIRLGNHTIRIQAGLRESQLLGLDKRYYLSHRAYIDPRVNLKYTLPYLMVHGSPMVFEIAAGAGLHTMLPVAAYLYPEPAYNDYVQLNYYHHNNEQWRRMNVKTFVDDRTNYSIRAARNFKWEVRGDISWDGNRLSVTYFRERMNDAFRWDSELRYRTYNRYDASGWNPEVNGVPDIDKLPYVKETRIALLSTPCNASLIKKEGVEFTLSTKRMPVVRTRLTVNGAWFKTTLTNSTGQWYKPTIIVNNKELQYAGYYNDPDGTKYQSFNTNFTFDTDIPSLRLNISLSVQNMWFTSSRTLPRSGIPLEYVDIDGVTHPWTDLAAADPYLKQLIRTYSSSAFDERRVPAESNFNLKATKKLWNDRLGIALYVNCLLSIAPDYYVTGILQRRYSSPYFGMELNLKL